MSFQQTQLTKSVNQAQDIFDEYIYRPTNGDTLTEVTAEGYFAQSRYAKDAGWVGSLLTFYIDGVLYNSRIDADRVTLLSGASSFAIGPTPNEFRAGTRDACIVMLDAETIAYPDWVAVYDSAPLGSTGTLNVKIFYAVDGNQFMELLGRDNGAWAVNQSFEGIVGPQGKSGNGVKSSFNSVAEMNTYYSTDERYKDLATGDNNSVTIDGAVFQYEWAGSDSPSTYDPDLFRLAEIGTTAGSLIMGPTSIESGSEVLMFKNSTGGQHYIVQSFFDQSGSSVPQYYKADAIVNFDLALVADDSLSLPIDFETIFPDTNIFTTYTIKPSKAGSFQFNTYLGTKLSHDQFPILSENIEISSGDVGNDLTVIMKNPAVINSGQELYTELSGTAKLFGGLQTEGPESGQTTMYAKLGMQTIEKYDLALQQDVTAPVVSLLGGKAIGFQDDSGDIYATPQFTVDLASTTTGKPFYYKGNEAAPTTDIIGTAVSDYDFELFSYTWTQSTTQTYEAMTIWATIACEINVRIRPMEDLSTTVIRSEIIRVDAGDVIAPQFLPCYRPFELEAGKVYKMDITKNSAINHVAAKGENLGPSYVPYFGLLYYAPASFSPENLAVEANLYPIVTIIQSDAQSLTATTQPLITAQVLTTGRYKVEYGCTIMTVSNTERRFVGIDVKVDTIRKGRGVSGIESASGTGTFYNTAGGVSYFDVAGPTSSLDVDLISSAIINTSVQDIYVYVTKLS